MVTQRCVRFRSSTFLHGLTLLYLAEPLFFMHHAVSDRKYVSSHRVGAKTVL